MINAKIITKAEDHFSFYHLVEVNTGKLIASFARGYAGREPITSWARQHNIKVEK